ncbi:hypothetical protein [Streptomyces globisporus]|uniref:hypothetical protein n=1 Tax=Streptomyces globisporus TaxID=1908 RepID=UPI0037C643B5
MRKTVQDLIEEAVRNALWKAFIAQNPDPGPTEADREEALALIAKVEQHAEDPEDSEEPTEERITFLAGMTSRQRHWNKFRASPEYLANYDVGRSGDVLISDEDAT